MGLLAPEGVDGGKPGGAAGGVDAEEHADADRDGDGEQRRARPKG